MIRKYTVLPGAHTPEVVAAWIAHTYVVTCFYTTPRIVASSPQPGSGKTRLLEVLALLCNDPRHIYSATPAALFRRIGKAHQDNAQPPTILYDEADALFGPSRPNEQTEQLRALMNAGYKKGATVDRCEGTYDALQVVSMQVFAPLALAGLAGNLPDTIISRGIVIEMKKRAPGECVSPFKERVAAQEAAPLVKALTEWAPTAHKQLGELDPRMPKGVVDRPAEVWEPLLAIADLAGGEWPEMVRKACKEFVFAPKHKAPTPSLELLRDIQTIMGHGTAFTSKMDRIKTNELLDRLYEIEDAPWSDNGYGKRLTPRGLSQLLSEYGIAPTTFRSGGKSIKGYVTYPTKDQAGLADAWLRYLPPPPAK